MTKTTETTIENDELTVSAFARESGLDRRTIDHGLARIGVEPARIEGRSKFYRRIDLMNACANSSDAKKWATEYAKARALRERLAYDMERSHLIEGETALKMVRDVLQPIRQFVFSLPKMMAARCNPTDPVLAQMELEKHVRQGMEIIAQGERAKLQNQTKR